MSKESNSFFTPKIATMAAVLLALAVSTPFAVAEVKEWSAAYSLGTAEEVMRSTHETAEMLREMEAQAIAAANERHGAEVERLRKHYAARIAPIQEKWAVAKVACLDAANSLGIECNPAREDFPKERPAPKSGKKPSPAANVAEVDLDALAEAVARHETGKDGKACQLGSAVTHNNCFGIRECWGGQCYGFRRFDTTADSYEAFKELWARAYGGRLPTVADAKYYSGSDRWEAWHSNVHTFYQQITAS